MKKYNYKKSSAFTIVELLLYMSLITIFIGVLTQIFVGMMNNQLRSSNKSRSAIDARFVMQKMFYDFENSSDFDQTILGYSLSNNDLFFQGDKINSQGVLIENLTFTKYQNSVQIKFDIDGESYQTTINKR